MADYNTSKNQRRFRIKQWARVILVGAALLTLPGCLGINSTGQGEGTTDGNVTTFCDHGNRVYVDHTAGALTAVKGDPSCGA